MSSVPSGGLQSASEGRCQSSVRSEFWVADQCYAELISRANACERQPTKKHRTSLWALSGNIRARSERKNPQRNILEFVWILGIDDPVLFFRTIFQLDNVATGDVLDDHF